MHDESRDMVEALKLTAIAVLCAVVTASAVIGLSQASRPASDGPVVEVSLGR